MFKELGSSGNICEISEISFVGYLALLSNRRVKVEMCEWIAVPNNINTSNHGAGPCLIVWQYLLTEHRMVRSGHFPESSKERYRNALRFRIDSINNNASHSETPQVYIPNESEILHFGSARFEKSYEKYYEMLEQIQPEARDSLVLLFGHNLILSNSPHNKWRHTTEAAIELNGILHSLNQIGVPSSKIIDFRAVGRIAVDNTLYDPSKNILYHNVS